MSQDEDGQRRRVLAAAGAAAPALPFPTLTEASSLVQQYGSKLLQLQALSAQQAFANSVEVRWAAGRQWRERSSGAPGSPGCNTATPGAELTTTPCPATACAEYAGHGSERHCAAPDRDGHPSHAGDDATSHAASEGDGMLLGNRAMPL